MQAGIISFSTAGNLSYDTMYTTHFEIKLYQILFGHQNKCLKLWTMMVRAEYNQDNNLSFHTLHKVNKTIHLEL